MTPGVADAVAWEGAGTDATGEEVGVGPAHVATERCDDEEDGKGADPPFAAR